MVCSLSLAMSAKAIYLLPTADKNASDQSLNVYDILPWEGDGTEANVEVSPERRAYEWCKDTYNEGEALFLTVKDVKEGALLNNGKPAMSALWINVDRVGLSLGDFDALFNDDFTVALGNYVKAGGNLYLSKQATRLVTKIGRAQWWPNDYKSNGYFDASDEWQMCVHFCTDGNIDNPFHASLTYMENGQPQDGLEFVTRFPLVSGDGNYRRTDNNCAWGDFGLYAPDKGGCDIERRNGIENGMGCKVLGGWGHTRGLDYAGFIEFYPQGDYKGTVMVMGLAAYQWGAQNKSEYNIKNLTKGILKYLEGSAFWGEGGAPHDGKVGDSFICSPLSDFQGYHIDLVSTNPAVASFEGGVLTLNAMGTTTIQAIYTGDGKQSCKTQIVLEQEITVDPKLEWEIAPQSAFVGELGKKAVAKTTNGTIVYSSSDEARVIVDQDGNLTFLGYDEGGKVTITATVTIDEKVFSISGELDANLPNVKWINEPADAAYLNQTVDVAAQLEWWDAHEVLYETSNCTYLNGKLTMTALGTATIRPYVLLTADNKAYYGETKSISVADNITTYTRATAAGKYGTICLERTPKTIEGATFFAPVEIVSDGSQIIGINLEEVPAPEAGVGYYFLANAAEVVVSMDLNETALTIPVSEIAKTHGMLGTFGGGVTVPNDQNEMILSNNQLWYGQDNTVGEHRAWIKLSELQEWIDAQGGAPAPVPGRRRVTMSVNQTNTTTGLENAECNVQSAKLLRNGQLYIQRGDCLYTADGQLVK